MSRLFFSYSHRDEDVRNELEVHLTTLKRQGVIETWHDRRILAGDEFANAISEEIELADIILLLVSPYFIASEYCYAIEMKRALERHSEGSARVIPVILHPCDWHDLPFGKLVATPKDGKPISKYPNLHDAFLEVTLAIKESAKLDGSNKTRQIEETLRDQQNAATSRVESNIRSGNLRVKREFNDRDIDQFVEESYEYISKYFEGSLDELQERNKDIDTEYVRVDANHFTAKIYRSGSRVSQCKIWKSDLGSRFGGKIPYSSNASGDDSGYNEQLTVQTDGYTLTLHPLGMAHMFHPGEKPDDLSQEGAAEYYWSMLIRVLQ